MSRKKLRTIGVLGGMGPEAGVRFVEEIVKACGAGRDQEHPPVVLYSLPQVPDRTEAIVRGGPDPVPAIRRGLSVLERAGADFAAISCISAHYFWARFAPRSPLPLFSLIDETLMALQRMRPAPRTIGLLATTGTVRSGILARPFKAAGIEVIVPSAKGQARVMAAIYGKRGSKRGLRPARPGKSCSRSLRNSSEPGPRPSSPGAPRSRSSCGPGTCRSRSSTPWSWGPARPSAAPAPASGPNPGTRPGGPCPRMARFP